MSEPHMVLVLFCTEKTTRWPSKEYKYIFKPAFPSLYSVVVVIPVSFFLAFLIYFIKLSDGHYPFCAACSYQF